MNCTNCGAENPPGRRFCDNCGSALARGCPNCGDPNRSDARYCGNCGTRLGEGLPEQAPTPAARPVDASERRLVSVLFADLVGFTPFAEERDPEHVRDTLSRYFETARAVIERHGGTVEKFIGDAVMAVWGTPVAHEDDAERAVRAALELLPAVRALEGELQARAAVLSGEAAVNVGAADQALLAGDLVNTAARLQASAAPGTVLVGESTMRAAGRAIAFEPAGEQALKGKASALPAWQALRIVAERGGRSRTDKLEPPFVGRDGQLTLLKELLHATGREGRARLVALTGPAGIGKSRLAWELEKYVDGVIENVYWHSGRSPSYGEGVSFWALGEMVRRRCRLAEKDDEAATRERVAATLSEYVADEQDRQWLEPALLALLGVEAAPAGGREVLFAAWRTFFERIAERGTTVLLFEDLQFADSGLLDFIDHLLEWGRNSPIMILALARPELLERRPTFGSATRHFNSMPLEPLADEEMRELLRGIVPDLDGAAVEAIVARADGIPLYAVETIRMLIADGRLEACDDGTCRTLQAIGELAIPDSLRSLIASRLDALASADRLLLQQASVLGQSFTLEAIGALDGAPADELSDRLRTLVRRELLDREADPRSPERGHYRFVQGLIREVAYGTLGRRERREKHLAAARYYEALGDDETAGTLASHYLAAYQSSEAGPAADAVAAQARLSLRGAAERASSLGAYTQAGNYLEQALAVTRDAGERAELLERAAHVAESDGQYERGLDLARQAIAAYQELGNRAAVARATGVMGTLHIGLAQHGDAVETFRAALAGLPEEQPELRAELLARLSRALMRSRQDREAVEAADEALVLAEPRGLLPVIAEAIINKAATLGNSGRWREAAALGQAGVELAGQAGSTELQLRAMNNLASTISDDQPARAVQITSDALALARRLGLRGMHSWLVGTLSIGRYWEGSGWDESIELLRESMGDAGNPIDEMRSAATLLAFLHARAEPDDQLLARVVEISASTEDPPIRAMTYLLQGEARLLQDDHEAAYELFTRGSETDPSEPTGIVWSARLAIWLGDRPRLEQAGRLMSNLPYSGRTSTGARQWIRGALAVQDGRHAEGLADLSGAIRLMREITMEFEAARMIIDGLRLLPGEPQLMELEPYARRVFERLGARFYLVRLDAALALGGRGAAEDSRDANGRAARAGLSAGRQE